jgi:hypothetical protein
MMSAFDVTDVLAIAMLPAVDVVKRTSGMKVTVHPD